MRRFSALVPLADTARCASVHAWRILRACCSNFSPSVVRFVPARERVKSRAPTLSSSATTRAEMVDCVTFSRSAVR